jgi:uncharacterized protein DUF4038/collagenase-like protein with putative collagen-binding domain
MADSDFSRLAQGGQTALLLAVLLAACKARPPPRPPPFTPAPVAFPLHVAVGGRTLADAAGKPFLLIGDGGWSLIANLNRDEAGIYLDDRKTKGFSAVLYNLLEHKFAVHAPANRAGEPPFLRAGDFSTPNPAYFDFAGQMVDLAGQRGLLVLLDVMYLGNGGGDEGFWNELVSAPNGKDACFRYGQFVGARFKDRKNLIFVIGGDFTPPAGSEGEARLRRIVEGVKAAGATQPWTAHGWYGLSGDLAGVADLLDLDGIYRMGPVTYPDARRAFERAPPLPAFVLETGYEEERFAPGDPASIRRRAWQPYLAGATAGVFYGHRDVWEFATGSWNSGYRFGHRPWRESLDAPGALAMQAMREILDPLRWPDLVPAGLAGTKPLVIAGGGEWESEEWIAAAADRAGRLIIAYLPPGHRGPVRLDLSVLSGPAAARWRDPCDAASAPDFAVSRADGKRSFDPPGRNSCGDRDWVLVVSR